MLILGIIIVDFLIGCFVLTAIDDKKQSLFKWASSSKLMFPFVVLFWFVILYFWYKNKQ